MKIRLAGLSLLLLATPALAHDFWIQPQHFRARPGAPLAFNFLVGHGKFRDRWNNNNRIMVLQEFSNRSKRDLRAGLRDGSVDLVASFATPGLRLIAMQTSHSVSELPAIRFKDYAREEGLAPILAARRRAGTTNSAGREKYSRRAKSMIQIGQPLPTDQALATRPVGLKLEIVPDRNPYALDASRILPVHVLFNGRRLPYATVKLTNLGADERPVAIAVTDKAGRARFRVPATGQWLLNVVWAEPVRGDPKVEFDTTFSSLTLGYPAASRTR
ncbi:MAG: DUF4198 domain-containing protein [Sphingomicrobium sp.]